MHVTCLFDIVTLAWPFSLIWNNLKKNIMYPVEKLMPSLIYPFNSLSLTKAAVPIAILTYL